MTGLTVTLTRPIDSDVEFAASATRPAAQQPTWGVDPAAVVAELATRAPLVDPGSVDLLRARLAAVARGEAIVLVGGDCAETFAARAADHVPATVATLTRMATTLEAGSGMPVVRVGRLAGQYAKPRSADRDAQGLPVYRGDAVNCAEADPVGRVAQPARMLRAYDDARHRLDLLARSCGASRMFTGHEALLMDYERALVRRGPDGRRYGLSGHFLWVGERTRQADGAHLALAASIANPVGVKLGPSVTPAEVAEYVQRLDPYAEPGRVTLIPRMGHRRVRDLLGPIVERVQATGRQVVWQCDPMHANTRAAADGHKTRDVDDVVEEVRGFVEVHRALGTHPGGVHFELTGHAVTECVGGAQGLTDDDLGQRYESTCDPRLNAGQSAEVAARIAGLFAPGPT